MSLKPPLLRISLIFTICFSLNKGYSQLYSSGQDPATTQWLQIQTSNFQIIFPKGFQVQANYFANAMEEVYAFSTKSLQSKPRKISILFHNQNIIPNGTTVWAPRRIDLYSVGPQDSYAEYWLKQLAVHEYRHVVQIEKLHEGFIKTLGVIFGEQATGGLFGTFVPNWFMEGDAVALETALSKSGRGRIPAFEMLLKAQLLEKGIYPYEKAAHNSYKDFVPSEYHLGYYLVAYGRERFGMKFWDKVLTHVSKNPIAIAPFSSGMEKAGGIRKRKFYEAGMQFLMKKWKKELKDVQLIPIKSISQKNTQFTNYTKPILYQNKIIALKSGMDHNRQIVEVSENGKENKLITLGPGLSQAFSQGGGLLCWTEIEPDVRWDNRNYSVIKLYDYKLKRKVSFKSKSRYFSPQLNKEGTQLLCVEVGTDNQYSIVIMNVMNGAEISRFDFPNYSAIMYPKWSDNQNEIVFTALTKEGIAIKVIDLNTRNIETILSPDYIQISKPYADKENIYFIGAYSGTNNVYALNRKTKKLTQLSSVKYGVGDFIIHGNELILSNYTADGFEIAKQDIDKSGEERRLSDINSKSYHYAEMLSKQENNLLNFDRKELKTYTVKKYSKSSGLFHIHSWGPISVDADDNEIKPGLTIMAQNLLSTAFTTLGYEYDVNDKAGRYFLNFTYKGWYPVIHTEIQYIKRRSMYRDTLNNLNPFTYHEFSTEVGIRQPLNYSKGDLITSIRPGINYIYSHQKVDEVYPIKFKESNLQLFNYEFSAQVLKRKSLRDIYPKWGLGFFFNHYHSPFTKLEKSYLTAYEGVIFLPGLINHHGFRFYGGYQKRKIGTYNIGNKVDFVRGMTGAIYENLYTFRSTYKFPLLYPDWDLSSFMYLKRMNLGFFFDYTKGQINSTINHPEVNEHFYSTGVELNLRAHFLSFVAPVDIGLRGIYFPETKKMGFEFLISVDFRAIY